MAATLNQCYPQYYSRKLKVTGSAYLKIEWSVYSALEKKIVLVATTEGSTRGEIASDVGEKGLLLPAFEDATRFLANASDYRAVVDPPEGAQEPPAPTADPVRIRRVDPYASPLERHLETIRKSVVTITANRGGGSGFVLSADGIVLTAEHVVSDSRYVKASTGAGKECYGEVISSSKRRDLALIRLDCGGLTPLPLARKTPTEGAEVYAIGTPLTEKLEFSVTKGVVSGLRKEGGLDYIQSDVTILPGSSGGPLLDASGNAVGVAAILVVAGSAPVGVNFFVPVADIGEHLPIRIE